MKNRMRVPVGSIVIAAVMFCAIPGSVQAATIQFSASLDLSTCGTLILCDQPMATQTIANGDVVDYTVNFANSQQLTLFDDDGGSESFRFWFFAGDNNSSFTISNISVQLLDQVGALNAPLTSALQSQGSAHLGPAFNGDFVATGSSVSFTGYRVQFSVDSIAVSPHDYSRVVFGASVDRSTITAVASEPGSLLLLGMGVASLAAGGRFRRTAHSLQRIVTTKD